MRAPWGKSDSSLSDGPEAPHAYEGAGRARARARAKYPEQFVLFYKHVFFMFLRLKSSKIRLNRRDVNFQLIMGTLMLPFNSIYDNAPEHVIGPTFAHIQRFVLHLFRSKFCWNRRDVNFQLIMETLMLPFTSIYDNAPEHVIGLTLVIFKGLFYIVIVQNSYIFSIYDVFNTFRFQLYVDFGG